MSGAVLHPSLPQQPWKNSIALSATNEEAPVMDISADLHGIKIIKKEGRLKDKWL